MRGEHIRDHTMTLTPYRRSHVMSMKSVVLAVGVAASLGFAQADTAAISDSTAVDAKKPACELEEKELMELGGAVRVDLTVDPSSKAAARQAKVSIGEVNLSASVNIAPPVRAGIAIYAADNLSELSIDEALVEWNLDPKPITLTFGQQYHSHGLLSTHLISDPLMLDFVQYAAPGIAACFSAGSFTPGIAVAFTHTSAETHDEYRLQADSTVVKTEVVDAAETNYFAGIAHLDVSFMENSTARLSCRWLGPNVDVALGTGLVLGHVTLDVEGAIEALADDDLRQSGYYLGVAWGINDNLEIAARYDGLSEDSFKDLTHRIGLGATVDIKWGVYVSVEGSYAYESITKTGTPEIALEMGLEQTVKLPGFRRKTLTTEGGR